MVRLSTFAQLQLMDGMLQMRLTLDGRALRKLPLCLADQCVDSWSAQGMQ